VIPLMACCRLPSLRLLPTLNPMQRSIQTAIFLLTVHALSAQELYEAGIGRSPRWASFENSRSEKGSAGRENKTAKGHAFDSLKAGQSVTLMEYHGSGVIRRIWLTLNDRSPEMLRSLTLAAYWDRWAIFSESPTVNSAPSSAPCFRTPKAVPSTVLSRCPFGVRRVWF
jgi:hypothetical protein